MSPELQNLIKIMEFTNQFQLVKRNQNVPRDFPTRLENDAEHSYQLTMAAWYLISTEKLTLNIDLVIKYGLVHDLVETYAGDLDPFMYTGNENFEEIKKQNEAEAFSRIKNEFKEFTELSELIHRYEQKEDLESRFVYALDKIIAHFNITFLEKKNLEYRGIALETIIKQRNEKIAKCPELLKYIDEAIEIWKLEPGFFAEIDYIPEHKAKNKTLA
jgi:5'-deoxynucleotidase YfbR-like HD superfamily hydrolase